MNVFNIFKNKTKKNKSTDCESGANTDIRPDSRIPKLTKAEKKELKSLPFKEFEKRYTDAGDNNIQLSQNMYFNIARNGKGSKILVISDDSKKRGSVLATFMKDAPDNIVFVCLDENLYTPQILWMLNSRKMNVRVLSPCGNGNTEKYDPIIFSKSCDDDCRIAKELVCGMPKEYRFADSSEDPMYNEMESAMLAAYISYVRTMCPKPSLNELATIINNTSFDELSQVVFDGDESFEIIKAAQKKIGAYKKKVESCLKYDMEIFYSNNMRLLAANAAADFDSLISGQGAVFLKQGEGQLAGSMFKLLKHDFVQYILNSENVSRLNEVSICFISSSVSALRKMFKDEEIMELYDKTAPIFLTAGNPDEVLSFSPDSIDVSEYMIDESSDSINAAGKTSAGNAFFVNTANAIIVYPSINDDLAQELQLHPIFANIQSNEVLVVIPGEKNPIKDKTIADMITF